MLKHRFRSRALVVLAAIPLLGLLAACGGDAAAGGSAAAGGEGGTADSLRLGYFANVTHAAAIVGVDEGFIPEALGETTLETQVFNAGPAVVEALFAGAIDASYIGPNPAINAYGQSDGEAIRIIAGATSGGAQLVVRDGIDSVEDLRGTTLATPQLGNTQDVALRAWLTEEDLENSVEGGGDVTISPTPNADTLQLFQAGEIDGAWLPEPWASRLVLEAGAEVFLDEVELWPDGRFVTTHLVVRTEFLEEYPGTVEALLRGHVEAVEWVGANPEEASTVVNDGIDALTGQPLGDDVLGRSWENLEVTVDPVASSLAESAADAFVAGTAEEEVDLGGIYDLSALNAILAEQGLTAVSAGGLGKE
jgi:NitT/TauT family transport system substrate-binding protein